LYAIINIEKQKGVIIMIISVQVIVKEDNTSFGRYNIPENEYDALVKYLAKKTTKELMFSVKRAILDADYVRPWNFHYLTN
jgi:hypothetical protein